MSMFLDAGEAELIRLVRLTRDRQIAYARREREVAKQVEILKGSLAREYRDVSEAVNATRLMVRALTNNAGNDGRSLTLDDALNHAYTVLGEPESSLLEVTL